MGWDRQNVHLRIVRLLLAPLVCSEAFSYAVRWIPGIPLFCSGSALVRNCRNFFCIAEFSTHTFMCLSPRSRRSVVYNWSYSALQCLCLDSPWTQTSTDIYATLGRIWQKLPLNSANFSIYRANEMNFWTQVLFEFGDSHLGLLISVSGVARGAVGAAAP